MKSPLPFSLDVLNPEALLGMIIDDVPLNSLMSFEGELVGSLVPRALYADDEVGKLRRGTLTPKQDFWVFQLDQETKDYLKREFIPQIGLMGNVLHVVAAHEDEVLFAAYDHFCTGCVILSQTHTFDEAYLRSLADRGAIKGEPH